MRSTLLASLAGYTGAALSASVLLSGGTIIAFDSASNALDIIRDGALLITEDRIAGLYDEANPTGIPADTEIVDCTNKIITPGFIDTHRHGWQTALKTLGSNSTLAEYFWTFSSHAAAPLYTADDVYDSQLAGLLEALNAGVTTTLDHAHNMWSTDRAEAGLDASIESGARVFWAAAIDPTHGYSVPDQIRDWKRWNKRSFPDDLVTLGVAYDGWDVGAPESTKAVADLIKNVKPAVVTIHWLGGAWPIDSSPSLVHSFGVLNTTETAVVFSHGPGLTAAQAQLLRSTNQFLSVTPESEMHYGHGHTYSHQILDQSALGVDTHLTFSTDIITQARLWLQRTRSRLFDEVLEHWEIPARNPSMYHPSPSSLILDWWYSGHTDHRPSVRKPSLPPRNTPRRPSPPLSRPRRDIRRRKSRSSSLRWAGTQLTRLGRPRGRRHTARQRWGHRPRAR
ncbi:hypothetical protein F5Y03DRAFT_359215 [Xylaria venustula]|nr:hypothetical protein F5Y03DRAFT_359215 [Xylaria venustula]